MLEYSPQESRLQTERTLATITYPLPPYRRLRGYAFDPSLSLEMDTADVNEVVYKIRWEDDLSDGPVGEYLEVVDYDPSSNVFYHPVNLNQPYVLAQDGLDPSESNPKFHQQMVYAVAMTTIQNMERALGRWIFWNGYRQIGVGKNARYEDEFVQRLRLYPHALREANAYYSPDKKAILFGYFPALHDSNTGQLPGGLVFSCLSHDIIAHEMTHAVLDGMHRRFSKDTNPDALAFHEAFSDIVALFQHFSFPEVLHDQIAKTRGDLSLQNQLGKLALQFGLARGNRNSLRDAIGEINEKTQQWEPKAPTPADYENATKPHERGSVLMAALFETFLTLYKSRVSDLIRITTNGTGKLPDGDLHPDLVKRLAGEAAKTSRHLLNMCIRALDYCPPVDLNFGDYLRALITADFDLVADDSHNYRLAIISAFRKRGIYPKGIKTLSPESLRWDIISDNQLKQIGKGEIFKMITKTLSEELKKTTDLKTRAASFTFFHRMKGLIHGKIASVKATKDFDELTGLCLEKENEIWKDKNWKDKDKGECPPFEVHSIRSAQRMTPNGDTVNQAIVVLTQRREIAVDSDDPEGTTFWFRGGCTLIFDLNGLKLRYCVRKNIKDDRRLEAQRRYEQQLTNSPGDRALYFGKPGRDTQPEANQEQNTAEEIRNRITTEAIQEPFAFLHR
ncbi:MAG: hypothetical protein LH609_23375 [Rudanella sp.]|nr:hypothetical protein [Rudanella sp.]